VPAPHDFHATFRELTPILLAQGWLFPPKILGGEVDELWDRCEQFRKGPLDEADRRAAESAISQVLVFTAFHPNYRAYYVWLAMQQPYVSSFSHLIETGVLHYFGRDYLSCVHSLLPAVEGILRAHFVAHNSTGTKDFSYRNLRRFLSSERPIRSGAGTHLLYRSALDEFLARWLWKPTNDADWDLSHLNRHYVLHGMGSEHYYRSDDCHRLFMFLDLYMEMLVLETGVGEYAFIPEDPSIRRRSRHYEALLVWSELTRPNSRRLALLREHPHFHDEAPRESYVQQVLRWARVMGLDRSGR
jgi:hypothetical protein